MFNVQIVFNLIIFIGLLNAEKNVTETTTTATTTVTIESTTKSIDIITKSPPKASDIIAPIVRVCVDKPQEGTFVTCLSVYIHRKWVLGTEACLPAKETKSVSVYMGTNSMDCSNGQERLITKVVHLKQPDNYIVMLMKITRPFSLTGDVLRTNIATEKITTNCYIYCNYRIVELATNVPFLSMVGMMLNICGDRIQPFKTKIINCPPNPEKRMGKTGAKTNLCGTISQPYQVYNSYFKDSPVMCEGKLVAFVRRHAYGSNEETLYMADLTKRDSEIHSIIDSN